MADKKISALTLAQMGLGDQVPFDDVSDTTDDSAGSSKRGPVPLSLFDHFADVATTHTDGTEDDLYSDTVVANTLSVNGDKIEAYYETTVVLSATAARRIKAYFAGTLIADTGSLTFTSAGTVTVYVSMVRKSASIVRVTTELVVNGLTFQPLPKYTEITGLTLSGTNILKITGIASGTGAAASDITANMGTVKQWPAAA